MPTDAASAYKELRERISPMVLAAGDRADSVQVPACPEWTPKDVVAHLSGICDDILSGRIEGVGTDQWTDAQVQARRGRSLAEVVKEWNELGARIDEILPDFPRSAARQLVFDALSHEYDLCEALDLAAPDRVQAEGPALDFAMAAFVATAAACGVPALTVHAGQRTWEVAGEGPGAVLTATPIDLLRSLTGRRTAGEVAALDWGGADPSPYLPAFEIGMFKLRETPIAP